MTKPLTYKDVCDSIDELRKQPDEPPTRVLDSWMVYAGCAFNERDTIICYGSEDLRQMENFLNAQ